MVLKNKGNYKRGAFRLIAPLRWRTLRFVQSQGAISGISI
jgi:hypothetical protein